MKQMKINVKKTIKRVILIFIVVSIFLFIKQFVNISIKNINISSTEWVEDINYLKNQLPKKHKNLFANITQSRYDSLLNKLIKDIPNLNSNEIQIRIMEIISLVGDGHTTVLNFSDSNSPCYPIEVYWFGDGYYIVNASKPYKSLIGKKITSINKKNITEIVDKLSTSISRDNKYGIVVQMPSLLRDPRVLKAYKITDNDTCLFQLITKDNKTTTSVSLTPDKLSSIKFVENSLGRISIIDSCDSDKLEYIKSSNAVYFRFDICKPYDKFFAQALSKIKDTKAKNFIIDIRNNPGGTFIPNNKLIEGCKSIQNNVKIYTLIGRKTFSSAINYAVSLKTETNSTFYGEPTSGKPNSYGDSRSLTLPNSNLVITYSTKYFKQLDSNEDSFFPNVTANLSIDDYLNDNDAVLNKVLKDIAH